MEWLWTLAIAAILFGPFIFVALRDRHGGAPRGDDLSASSTVTDSVRRIEGGDRLGPGSGKGGPLPPR